MKQTFTKTVHRLSVLATILGLLVAAVPHHTAAVTSNPAPSAKVSFTFDDGLASAITQAQPTLAKYGLTGTNYVITGCVGMTVTPNACRANNDLPYMTWAQIQQLQNSYGWEIGSHTVDHRCLVSSASVDPGDCQRAALTPAQVDAELSQSKNTLAANGINATDFAPPYGDYNNAVLAQIAKYYATMRGFQDQNDNNWPYDDYLLNDVTVQEGLNTVASIEAKIDQAIANNLWLVLTFHDIAATPSQNPDDYQYGTGELDQIAAYVAAKQSAGLIQSVHINQGSVTSDTNLLPNGTFNDGIADGWTTDRASLITADAGNNGSYPDATHAIKFISPLVGGSAHLFSPMVPVDPSTTYMFKNFLNVQAVSTGQVAFYVDEYDAAGNWISGQYLKEENSAFVENMNFTYKPTSAAVSKAALQVISAGTGITAYLDTAQLFPLTSVAPTNLVPNGTFNDGIADGWTTDDAADIKADAGNNGSPANQLNSISLASTSSNKHLFSPQISVSSAHGYNVNTYVDLRALTSGEVGLYVDEYDANGNWISGKYVAGTHTIGAGNVGFVYTPQSGAVAKASLQVIVVGNSNLSAYFDDVRWYQS